MASKIQVDKIARGSGTPEFTIPTADGSANQFLKTDGSGVLSFGSGVALTGSTNNTIPTVTGANALAGEANFTYDGNTLDIKNAGTASSIKVYCETSNLHYTEIKSGPHSGATSYTITLPNTPPSVSGQVLSATTAGVASWAAAESGLASVQTFTSSGTWTRPTGITKVIMEVQGAGGSGSNSPNTEQVQGGAAGGYAKKFLDVSSISTSTITVGAGGSAVTGSTSSTSAGNDGGDSSWADGTNTITANGGDGGVTTNDQPTVGATATGGDINVQGGDGFSRYSGSMPIGGTSMMGFGGMPRMQTRTTVSRPPRGYGSGGGGAHAYSGTAYDSDAGAAGIVIVWEFK